MRILVVESKPKAGGTVTALLTTAGYAVDCAVSLAEAHKLAKQADHDLIVLNRKATNDEEFAYLESLQTWGPRTPVFVVSEHATVTDRIAAFDMGADDFLPMPFDIGEFTARCRAILRRRYPSFTALNRVGRLELDVIANTISLNGATFIVAKREHDLLAVLIKNANAVCSRQQLEKTLFGSSSVSRDALDTNISRLRKTLRSANAGVTLLTAPKQGYVLRETEQSGVRKTG